MKHHEYQIYYGGHKYLLPFHTYCEDCKKIISNYVDRQTHFDKFTRSPKGRSGKKKIISSSPKKQKGVPL